MSAARVGDRVVFVMRSPSGTVTLDAEIVADLYIEKHEVVRDAKTVVDELDVVAYGVPWAPQGRPSDGYSWHTPVTDEELQREREDAELARHQLVIA